MNFVAEASVVLPRCCKAAGMTRVLLPELRLDPSIYPRSRLERSNVEYLEQVLRAGGGWWHPIIATDDLAVLDGWHRIHALRNHYGPEHVRVEVEVLRVRCDPADRLLAAALLNRAHGSRLSDDDAARVAARLAAASAGVPLSRAIRDLARQLAVPERAVRAALSQNHRQPVRRPGLPPPPLRWDRAAMVPEVITDHARWLDEALTWSGRRAVEDPNCAGSLRALHARLGRLLGVESL